MGARPAHAQTAADQAAVVPVEVTPGAVKRGKSLFATTGLCMACHGPEGKGGSIGPVLADTTWLHGKGTYAEIVGRIMRGVPTDSSSTGQVMPPRGGSTLKDDDVKAVAAYVWSISHPRSGG